LWIVAFTTLDLMRPLMARGPAIGLAVCL
jgi:hypothetical protein